MRFLVWRTPPSRDHGFRLLLLFREPLFRIEVSELLVRGKTACRPSQTIAFFPIIDVRPSWLPSIHKFLNRIVQFDAPNLTAHGKRTAGETVLTRTRISGVKPEEHARKPCRRPRVNIAHRRGLGREPSSLLEVRELTPPRSEVLAVVTTGPQRDVHTNPLYKNDLIVIGCVKRKTPLDCEGRKSPSETLPSTSVRSSKPEGSTYVVGESFA